MKLMMRWDATRRDAMIHFSPSHEISIPRAMEPALSKRVELSSRNMRMAKTITCCVCMMQDPRKIQTLYCGGNKLPPKKKDLSVPHKNLRAMRSRQDKYRQPIHVLSTSTSTSSKAHKFRASKSTIEKRYIEQTKKEEN